MSKYPKVYHKEFSLFITIDKLRNITLRQLQETFGINSYLIKCTLVASSSSSSSGAGNAFSMFMKPRVPGALINKRKHR